MKMKAVIEDGMFAPCGMNCMVCYRHCFAKKRKPCKGCLNHDETGKPPACQACSIKDCVHDQGLQYCYECNQFPCKRIKLLDKSYQKRYQTSLIANSLFVREHGLSAFMQAQRRRYLCSVCGGIISLHDRICTECREPIPEEQDSCMG